MDSGRRRGQVRDLTPSLWIGTSGYSYPDWAGSFYPEGLAERRWFEYYAAQFHTVELNVTFYRLPVATAFRHWYERCGKDFRFVLKGSRFITHIHRLKNPAGPLDKFFKAVSLLKEKLSLVLWQLPPRFRADLERLEGFLKAFRKASPVPCVFEFRHESWFSPEVTELLRASGAAYCRSDFPNFYLDLEIPDTAPFVYLRRHGPPGGRLYAGSYSDAALRRDARDIRQWLKQGKAVYAFFNNDIAAAAPRDAKRLEEAISSR